MQGERLLISCGRNRREPVFKETTHEEEQKALAFIQQAQEGQFALICEECLELGRIDLALEEPEEGYYYSYA